MIEKKKNNQGKMLLFIILMTLTGLITFSMYKSNTAIFKAKEVQASIESVDSVKVKEVKEVVAERVKEVVDSTLIQNTLHKIISDNHIRVYDVSFLHNNTVIVDENDSIIGIPRLYVNDSIIEVYYNQHGVDKTALYTRMKMRLIKRKEK